MYKLHLLLNITQKVNISPPFIQIRKQRHREVKRLAQGHTATVEETRLKPQWSDTKVHALASILS